jgi:hypothetical protein
MSDTIKNKINPKKEGREMKKTISTIVSIITVLFIFVSLSYAQSHNNNGWHGSMANLADQEDRAKEQDATAKKNEKIVAEITVVVDDEKKHLICPVETVSEKEMKC